MQETLYSFTNPQNSIWLTEQFSSNTSLNNVGGYVFIHERVNFEALEMALNEYIKINEATRFQIRILNNEPLQYVKEYSYFPIKVDDLKNEDELNDWNQKIIQKPFELIDSPLCSLNIFRLPDGRGGFNATLHHLITDAWGMSLLISQVMNIYSKLINKEKIDILTPNYSEFINSQKEYLESPKFQKAQDFWNEVFDSTPEISSITPIKNGVHSTTIAKREAFTLNTNIYKKITDFCKSLNCSIYTLFMAIYSIYLSKLNNIKSPIIGTPVLNRTNFKEKNTSGMFVSTVPFKIDVLKDLSFEDFLKNVSSMQMSIFRHQKYPYSDLLEHLKNKYDFTENLYDIVLSYQNARDNKKNCSVEYSSNWLFSGHCLDTLQVHFYDMDNTGNLNIFYDYQIEKLCKNEIIALHNRIMHIIDQIMNNSNILIQDIEIVTPDEKEQILNQFNQTAIQYNKEESLVTIFEKNAAEFPNKTALVFENESWTYEILNKKANQLAHYLKSKSILPNDKIAILLPRCSELILAMLAIKKAACAYLLLEPNLPLERIQYMLKNAGISLLITNKELYQESLPSSILIEDIDFEKFSTNNLNLSYLPEDFLSIVYTSGSTGMPKGILVKNFSILNLVLGYCHTMKAHTLENFISICSVSFDMFAAEVWIPILLGKKLVLANEEEAKNPLLMSQLITKESIQFMLITSSKMDLLLFNKTTSACLIKLKAIQLGGEVLSPKFYNKLINYTTAKIYNGYGPSETTSCATCKLITSADHITIGTPLPNVQVYICNHFLNLCPIGTIGELCISGDGVSYGYVNQPELTKENFVKNPFGDGLLYKTGDLAKLLLNGEIEYIGRNDSQVKIRGLRIELEEINKVVENTSGVNKAITIVRNLKGIDCICSYIVTNANLDESTLKNTLKEKLPYYMVPSHIIFMDSLPLTTNGKIDTKSLPLPQIAKQEYIAPSTETQKIVVSILEELLKLEKISMNSNFFDLGGDSLCAIKLVTEIYTKLKVKLEVKNIFEHDVILNLCNYIDSLTQQKNETLIPVSNIQDSYPLSSAQSRIYYTVNMEGKDSVTYNTPGGITFDAKPDVKKLEDCFNVLIKRHSALRTYFTIENNTAVQKIVEDFKIELPVYQENYENLEQVFQNFIKPFDLSKLPLFRACLIEFTDGKYMLLFDMHHIICDGQSISIFIDELCNLYNGNNLPESAISYIDYAVWENQCIKNGDWKNHEDFWLKKFENEVPILNMPTTYTRPSVKSFEGNKLCIRLENANEIYSFAKEFHTTPYILLLSIYYVLLYKYTGQKEIIVGSPIMGRNYSQLHNIIGMFVNTLPLKATINSDQTFSEFLEIVKEDCFDCFENQVYPLDLLIKKLNIARDISRNPLFDTMFTYQNNGMKTIHLGKINADYYIPDNHTSKFDFSLEITPEESSFKLVLEYATKLFSSDFMSAFLSHYKIILNRIMKNPNEKISEISILSNEELEQINNDFNNTEMNYSKNESILDLFEKQVQLHPKRDAIIFENTKLTYEELNQKVTMLSNYLLENGIKKDDIIGIMLNRSFELIISMLAILKIGAAYLPIDPTYPEQRIQYMIEDSKIKVLLSQQKLKNNLSNINISCIFVDLENNFIYNTSYNKEFRVQIDDSTLAYLIYTSGSTGKPKGVMVKQVNLTNFILGTCYAISLKNKNIVSVTTMCFDIFVLESLLPLSVGSCIILANEAEQNNPILLNSLCLKHNVNVIQTTPSRFDLLLNDENSLSFIKNMTEILLGGEAFPKDLLTKLHQLTNANIYNMYGPTETTVWSSIKNLTDTDLITIGTPISNTQMLVLDNDLNPVPIGVNGTLYIAGDGVCSGYYQREDLTSARFIVHPLANGKIYNTGDLVRWLPNGELYYLGRTDFQVKIRGLRIELEEIEACMNQYKNIETSVVTIKKINQRDFLCGYFVANGRITISHLKNDLSKKLPSYMVPTYLMQLKELPYTPNGKIDRNALPIPTITNTNIIQKPQTSLEKKILNIWKDLLSVEKISTDDNFFDIGGDSISALKLQVELLKIGININYSDIFQNSTIQKLAFFIENNMNIEKPAAYKESDFKEINQFIQYNQVSNLSISEGNKITNVLLTGSTGFLGIHILEKLLEIENINVYCLIRPDPSTPPENKLKDKLNFYFGNKLDSYLNNRIFVISGDITMPNLGLDDKTFNDLFSKISHVINSAANVKHYGDYKEFENTNVQGVQNLIEICKKIDAQLIQISTISVSGNTLVDLVSSYNPEEEICFGENNLFIGQSLENVYVRSKFEAEKLMLGEIVAGNLKGLILRIGNITNRYADGKFQINEKDNAFMNRLKAFLKINMIPDYILKNYMEFTPVDSVADAIVKSIQYYQYPTSILHLYNSNHIVIEDFITYLKKLGNSIKVVNKDTFDKVLKKHMTNSRKVDDIGVLMNDLDESQNLVYKTNLRIVNTYSLAFLDKINFKWPQIDFNYIKKVLNNMK